MSVIKELKTTFSSIAWCPFKEHATVMALASMKDLTPVKETTNFTLSLYDWNLEDMEQSKYVAEVSLESGMCSLCWGCTVVPNSEGSVGLICVGTPEGSVQLYVPTFSADQGWSLLPVCPVLVVLGLVGKCVGRLFCCSVDLF